MKKPANKSTKKAGRLSSGTHSAVSAKSTRTKSSGSKADVANKRKSVSLKMQNARKLRVLDLFSGCGGLSMGFALASHGKQKFEIAAALDFNKHALDSYKLNFKDAQVFNVDIRTADIGSICSRIGPIDVVIGGPSCQGFSTHGNRLADDPRNFLYKHFLEFISVLKPKWVLMENVTGLLRYEKGRFRKEITSDFQKLDYVVSFAQLQAADYGVPQVRKRVFFVANRLGVPFFFPKPTHRPSLSPYQKHLYGSVKPATYNHLTLFDALSDLPKLGLGTDATEDTIAYPLPALTNYQEWIRQDAVELTQHHGLKVPDENLLRIRHIPQGGDWLDIPQNLLPSRFSRVLKKDATTLYYRLRWDRPAYTITTTYRNVSSGAFTHPDEDRALTSREAARLQSFPDTFQFSSAAVPSQIGNAVPPLLAMAIANAILAHHSVFTKGGYRMYETFKRSVHRLMGAAKPIAPGWRDAPPALLDVTERMPSPPLMDNQWNSVSKILKGESYYRSSQVNERGLLNAILYYAANGRNVAAVPSEYTNAATLLRWVADWKQRNLLAPLVNGLTGLNNLKITSKGNEVSLLGGEMKLPTRKRPLVNPKQHFATVLYEVESDSKCTTSQELVFGNE